MENAIQGKGYLVGFMEFDDYGEIVNDIRTHTNIEANLEGIDGWVSDPKIYVLETNNSKKKIF